MNNLESRKKLVTEQVVSSMSETLTKLLLLSRWSSYIADPRYNELNKQALNASIAYLLAEEARYCGCKIDMTKLPKITINRMFAKLILCDIREDFIEEILKLGNIERERFDEIIDKRIQDTLGNDFSKFIAVDQECLEGEIFRAATKLATRMELQAIKHMIPEMEYNEAIAKIEKEMNQYSWIPGFARVSLEYSAEMKLFQQISALRNRIRWQKRINLVKCGVLGHNFEVAIYAYLITLKRLGNTEEATKAFFLGVFHDLPETFTGDMPSPVKDSIPGLRTATELFELKMMNENVYKNLPPHLSEAMHAVMMEELAQMDYKPIIKQADYLSAVLECTRQLIAGTKDPYFMQVIEQELSRPDFFDEPFYTVVEKAVQDILK